MRQDFDVRGGPDQARANLPRLREAMADAGLDGLYIPHEDAWQNEYLPAANERLAWATGFTGSAGCAIVLGERAALFVDGRYTLQAREQSPEDLFEHVDLPDPGPFGWLEEQVLSGEVIGFDPRLVTPNSLERLENAAAAAGAELRALKVNPIDTAWQDRPALPSTRIVAQPLECAGQSSEDKRARIAAGFGKDGVDAAVLTAPASLAWLFNIRGGDVACSPLPLGHAILHYDASAELFLDSEKVDDALRAHLGDAVTLHEPDALEARLAAMSGKPVSLDPDQASAWFFAALERACAIVMALRDPVALPKACKNAAELEGTTRAHLRDGVAVTRFLHWLATEAQSGDVTEIDAAIKLEGFREDLGELKDLSFETISGAGPNGALPHYRVSTASNRALEPGTLYLVDSGGQYLDGTTDVTRTVPIGEPSIEMRRHYTLVLKGHIALAEARFPEGTTGTQLDTLARHALWQAGLDFDHGTGHGVGVYLGVHEGPQRIAKTWNPVALRPGMIVSNEPGYYRTGAYGIRIENLQYVTPPVEISGGERPMMGFQCLTLAPLARDLIDPSLLSSGEHVWVDRYHERVLEEIGPHLDAETRDWLAEACAPL